MAVREFLLYSRLEKNFRVLSITQTFMKQDYLGKNDIIPGSESIE